MVLSSTRLSLLDTNTLATELMLEALSALKHFLKVTTTNKGENMKTRSFLSRALLLGSLVLMLHTFVTARALTSQDNKTKISDAEAKAVQAVEAAPDINAKLAAAEEFVKKYPKSNARQHVTEYVVDQILGLAEPNQQLALVQKFQTVFTEKAEANAVKPALVDAYLHLNRIDEAFASGASHLADNGEDIQVLVVLAIAGVEQAKNRNPKYMTASQQYGAKAIELLEGDKKPANMNAALWGKQKAMLPSLYQEMAVISLIQQNPTDAQAKLEKSMKLNPGDPFTYVLLGSITNDEYQKVAQTFKSMPDGKAKDEMLQKANALLDKVIDHYAHAVGLAEGKPQYQQLHDQLLLDLGSYYRYRHSNSSDGLQKLIDSYKTP